MHATTSLKGHGLLTAARIPGHMCWPGYSTGGTYALNCGALYPQQVAGVALIDSATPHQFDLPDCPSFYSMFRRVSALFPLLARAGIARPTPGTGFATLPPDARDQARKFAVSPRELRANRNAFLELRTVFEQAKALKSLGGKPLLSCPQIATHSADGLPLRTSSPNSRPTASTGRRTRRSPHEPSPTLLAPAGQITHCDDDRPYDRQVQVRGVVWAGVRTEAFAETVAFFRDVLGVPLVELAPGFAWSKLEDSSQFEIFGPPDTAHLHFTTGPVPEFLVDDLSAATAELEAAGVEVFGPIQGTADQGWVHFRGPDGNVYGLTDGASYHRPS